MLKIADIDAILVEREVVDNLDGVLFTNLKLVSITYSYPYQLIMILEIEIAYKENISVMYLTFNL